MGMIYGITQAQKILVLPNFPENTGGFHQGGFFLGMGTWNFESNLQHSG